MNNTTNMLDIADKCTDQELVLAISKVLGVLGKRFEAKDHYRACDILNVVEYLVFHLVAEVANHKDIP
jgi:hypothetical protein